ncbi:sigma-54-dependent Fis family transcriptional regulator [Xinfangfangia sp. D13-10-4-6]|uniref:sigma-54-dependent transcriptional regulator n=1 Tax=Pseudogemmobacter hezensis TaxID=2737662 RepID=UPI001551DCF8|nr:sigma-54 dependent transcriptional regulator [Pseudogemmobacter hezensis]NPD14813.1 sigma-54-dependent Fis family transcriptional regulator [Pseudogemmobacter hezensis]
MSRNLTARAANAGPGADLPLVRVIEDDTDLLAAQTQALRLAGFRTEPFDNAAKALEGLGPDYPGVILSDVRMPGIDGFELHRRIRAMDPDLPVILLTGHGDVPMAVAALKAGAWDFLTKPVGSDVLAAALRRAGQARQLTLENRQLRAARPLDDEDEGDLRLSGDSAAMTHLRQTIARVAEAGVDALIIGQTGVGKEAVARALHAKGARRGRAFVHVVCAALDPARFDADFFGQAASAPRIGRVPGYLEKAHRGTLFLEGIDMLAAPLQARLLAILGADEFTPAGGTAPRPLDMRVLTGSATELSVLAQSGPQSGPQSGQGFRADLLYRLSGIVIGVPPLAARREDVPPLFRRLLLQTCRRLNLAVPPLSSQITARLSAHDWPGNLRELQQFAEAVAFGLTTLGPPAPWGADGQGGNPDGAPPEAGLAEQVAAYEAELIRAALRRAGGSVAAALVQLRLPRKTLYDKMARHGINPAQFRH